MPILHHSTKAQSSRYCTLEKGRSTTIDKELVAHRFGASIATYEKNAIVQGEISRQLISVLQRSTKGLRFSNVLEIGCCTGNLSSMLSDNYSINSLWLNDLVADFCEHAGKRVGQNVGRVHALPGDIEKTAIPHSLDLIISSSTFQWIADLPGLFSKLSSALHQTGHLAFSIFSTGTMEEIRILTGKGLHYHSTEELQAMLASQFQVLEMYSEQKRLFFPNFLGILRHIRQTGVGGVDRNRWSLKELRDLEKRYNSHFMSEEGLPLTYSSIFVIARKKGGEVS